MNDGSLEKRLTDEMVIKYTGPVTINGSTFFQYEVTYENGENKVTYNLCSEMDIFQTNLNNEELSVYITNKIMQNPLEKTAYIGVSDLNINAASNENKQATSSGGKSRSPLELMKYGSYNYTLSDNYVEYIKKAQEELFTLTGNEHYAEFFDEKSITSITLPSRYSSIENEANTLFRNVANSIDNVDNVRAYVLQIAGIIERDTNSLIDRNEWNELKKRVENGDIENMLQAALIGLYGEDKAEEMYGEIFANKDDILASMKNSECYKDIPEDEWWGIYIEQYTDDLVSHINNALAGNLTFGGTEGGLQNYENLYINSFDTALFNYKIGEDGNAEEIIDGVVTLYNEFNAIDDMVGISSSEREELKKSILEKLESNPYYRQAIMNLGGFEYAGRDVKLTLGATIPDALDWMKGNESFLEEMSGWTFDQAINSLALHWKDKEESRAKSESEATGKAVLPNDYYSKYIIDEDPEDENSVSNTSYTEMLFKYHDEFRNDFYSGGTESGLYKYFQLCAAKNGYIQEDMDSYASTEMADYLYNLRLNGEDVSNWIVDENMENTIRALLTMDIMSKSSSIIDAETYEKNKAENKSYLDALLANGDLTSIPIHYIMEMEVSEEQLNSWKYLYGGLPHNVIEINGKYYQKNYTEYGEFLAYYGIDKERNTLFSTNAKLEGYQRTFNGIAASMELDPADFTNAVNAVLNNGGTVADALDPEYIRNHEAELRDQADVDWSKLMNFNLDYEKLYNLYGERANLFGERAGDYYNLKIFQNSAYVLGVQAWIGVVGSVEQMGDAFITILNSDLSQTGRLAYAFEMAARGPDTFLTAADIARSTDVAEKEMHIASSFNLLCSTIWEDYVNNSGNYQRDFQQYLRQSAIDAIAENHITRVPRQQDDPWYSYTTLNGETRIVRSFDDVPQYAREQIASSYQDEINSFLQMNMNSSNYIAKFETYQKGVLRINDSSSLSQYQAAQLYALRTGDTSLYDNLDSYVRNFAINQYNASEYVKHDFTADWAKETYYDTELYKNAEAVSLVKRDNVLGIVANQVGNMAIPVVISLIPGVGKALSSAVLWTSAFGGAAQEAFKSGAGYNEAMGYATLSASTELAIEWLFGGISGIDFGSEWLDKLLTKGADKILGEKLAKNTFAQVMKKLICAGIGEGIEEVATDLVTPLWKSLTFMSDKSWSDIIGEEVSWSSLAQTFLISFLSSIVFSGVGTIREKSAYNKIIDEGAKKLMSENPEVLAAYREQAKKILAQWIGGQISEGNISQSGLFEELVRQAGNELAKNPAVAPSLEQFLETLISFKNQELTVDVSNNSSSASIITMDQLLQIEDMGYKGGYTVEDGKIKFKDKNSQEQFADTILKMAEGTTESLNNMLEKYIKDLEKSQKKGNTEQINLAIQILTEFSKYGSELSEVNELQKLGGMFSDALMCSFEYNGTTIEIPRLLAEKLTTKLSISEDGKITFKKDMTSEKFLNTLYDKAIKLCQEQISKNYYDLSKIEGKDILNNKNLAAALNIINSSSNNNISKRMITSVNELKDKDLIRLEVFTEIDGAMKQVFVYIDKATSSSVYEHTSKFMDKIQEIINQNKGVSDIYIGEMSYNKSSDSIVTTQSENGKKVIDEIISQRATYNLTDRIKNLSNSQMKVTNVGVVINNQNLIRAEMQVTIDGEKQTVYVYIDKTTDIKVFEYGDKVLEKVQEVISENEGSSDIYVGEMKYDKASDNITITQNKEHQSYIESINAIRPVINLGNSQIEVTNAEMVEDHNMIKAEVEVTVDGEKQTVNVYIDQDTDSKVYKHQDKVLEKIQEVISENEGSSDVYIGKMEYDAANDSVTTTQNGEHQSYVDSQNHVLIAAAASASTSATVGGVVSTETSKSSSNTRVNNEANESSSKKTNSEEVKVTETGAQTTIVSVTEIRSQVESYIENINKELNKFIETHKNDANFEQEFEKFKQEKLYEFNEKLNNAKETIRNNYSDELRNIDKAIAEANEDSRSNLESQREKIVVKMNNEITSVEDSMRSKFTSVINTATETVSTVKTDVSTENNVDEKVENRDNVEVIEETKDVRTDTAQSQNNAISDKNKLNDLLPKFNEIPSTIVYEWISGERQIDLGVRSSMVELAKEFARYVRENNIVLSEDVMNKLNVIQNLSENQTILNLQEFFNGQNPIVFDKYINVNGTSINIESMGKITIVNLNEVLINPNIKPVILPTTINGIDSKLIYECLTDINKLNSVLNGEIDGVDANSMIFALKTVTQMQEIVGIRPTKENFKIYKAIQNLYGGRIEQIALDSIESKLSQVYRDFNKLYGDTRNITKSIVELEKMGYTHFDIVEALISQGATITDYNKSRELYNKAYDYLIDKGYRDVYAAKKISEICTKINNLRGYETIYTQDGLRIHIQKGLNWDNQAYYISYVQQEITRLKGIYKTNIPVDVYVYDTFNPEDKYWELEYKKPGFRSAATGGTGVINIYANEEINDAVISHEYGHLIDEQIRKDFGLNERFANTNEWQTAIARDGNAPTNYAKTNAVEDFAESVAKIVEDPIAFKNKFPARFEVLSKYLNLESSSSATISNVVFNNDMNIVSESIPPIYNAPSTLVYEWISGERQIDLGVKSSMVELAKEFARYVRENNIVLSEGVMQKLNVLQSLNENQTIANVDEFFSKESDTPIINDVSVTRNSSVDITVEQSNSTATDMSSLKNNGLETGKDSVTTPDTSSKEIGSLFKKTLKTTDSINSNNVIDGVADIIDVSNETSKSSSNTGVNNETVSTIKTDVSTENNVDEKVENRDNVEVIEETKDARTDTTQNQNNAISDKNKLNDLLPEFNGIPSTIVYEWISGERQVDVGMKSSMINVAKTFDGYLNKNNIVLSEDVMNKLNVIQNLSENQTIANINEFFKGQKPIIINKNIVIEQIEFGRYNIEHHDVVISTLDVIEILEMNSTKYLELLKYGKLPNAMNITRTNLFDSIREMYSLYPDLKELYNGNYEKLMDLYRNSYILKSADGFVTVPNVFGEVFTERLEEFLNSPDKIYGENSNYKKIVIDSMNEFFQYLKNNGLDSQYSTQMSKFLELVENIPKVDSSIEIKTQLYEMFDSNGNIFGADQGAIRKILDNFKMRNVIETLCGKDTVGTKEFMKVLNDLNITNKDFSDKLVEIYNSNRFTLSEINEFNSLISQVIENYPGMSIKEAIQFLYLLETEEAGSRGICNYASMVNLIFDKYKNNAKLFEQDFGYPMYTEINGQQRLNTNRLLVDLYSVINNGNLVKVNNGKYTIETDNSKYINLGTNGIVAKEYLDRFLSKKGIKFNIEGTFYYNSYSNVNNTNSMMHYEDVITRIHDNLARGEHVHLTSDGFDLFYPDGTIAKWNVGCHIMSVVGITSNGNLIVDSWGEKLIFNLEEEMLRIGESYTDTEGFKHERGVVIASYDVSMGSEVAYNSYIHDIKILKESLPTINTSIGEVKTSFIYELISGVIPIYMNKSDVVSIAKEFASYISENNIVLSEDVMQKLNVLQNLSENQTIANVDEFFSKNSTTPVIVDKSVVENSNVTTIETNNSANNTINSTANGIEQINSNSQSSDIDSTTLATDEEHSLPNVSPKGIKNLFKKSNVKSDIDTSTMSDSQIRMLNTINSQISMGQTVTLTINQSNELSLEMLNKITDLSKVRFTILGGFNDGYGYLKAKYNQQRYIERVTYTGFETREILKEINWLQSQVNMNLPTIERAKQIYQLISRNYPYAYNFNSVYNGHNIAAGLRGIISNNGLGQKSLVCAGYAQLYQELCRRCGIECEYVRGDANIGYRSERHAWNVIKVDGKVIPVDVTWADINKWFGPSEEFQNTHIADYDEMYRDYNIRSNDISYYNSNVSYAIDGVIRTLNQIYDSNDVISILVKYVQTGNIKYITRTDNARSIISSIGVENVKQYLKHNFNITINDMFNQVSIDVTSQLDSVFRTLDQKYGTSQALRQLYEYINTGDTRYITSTNNAREIISKIPLKEVSNYIESRNYLNAIQSSADVELSAPPIDSVKVEGFKSTKSDLELIERISIPDYRTYESFYKKYSGDYEKLDLLYRWIANKYNDKNLASEVIRIIGNNFLNNLEYEEVVESKVFGKVKIQSDLKSQYTEKQIEVLKKALVELDKLSQKLKRRINVPSFKELVILHDFCPSNITAKVQFNTDRIFIINSSIDVDTKTCYTWDGNVSVERYVYQFAEILTREILKSPIGADFYNKWIDAMSRDKKFVSDYKKHDVFTDIAKSITASILDYSNFNSKFENRACLIKERIFEKGALRDNLIDGSSYQINTVNMSNSDRKIIRQQSGYSFDTNIFDDLSFDHLTSHLTSRGYVIPSQLKIVYGAHRMSEFYDLVRAYPDKLRIKTDEHGNKIIRNHPTIRGIYEIEYETSNGVDAEGNRIWNGAPPKTVYDSSLIDDNMILKYANEAIKFRKELEDSDGRLFGIGMAHNGLVFQVFYEKTGTIIGQDHVEYNQYKYNSVFPLMSVVDGIEDFMNCFKLPVTMDGVLQYVDVSIGSNTDSSIVIEYGPKLIEYVESIIKANGYTYKTGDTLCLGDLSYDSTTGSIVSTETTGNNMSIINYNFEVYDGSELKSTLDLRDLIKNNTELVSSYDSIIGKEQRSKLLDRIVEYIDGARRNGINVDIDTNVERFYEAYKSAKQNNLHIVNGESIIKNGSDMLAISEDLYDECQRNLLYDMFVRKIGEGIDSIDTYERVLENLIKNDAFSMDIKQKILQGIDLSINNSKNLRTICEVLSRIDFDSITNNDLYIYNLHEMFSEHASPIYLPKYVANVLPSGKQSYSTQSLLSLISGEMEFPPSYNFDDGIIENCNLLYKYLQEKGITLSEDIMQKLEFISNLNENQTILNLQEFFNGQNPMIVDKYVDFGDGKLETLKIIDILKMETDSYKKFLRDGNTKNLFNAVEKLFESNSELRELYNDNFEKIKDLYNNSYVLDNSYIIVPKTFGEYNTVLLEEIINNPRKISKYNGIERQKIIKAINKFAEYLKSNGLESHYPAQTLEFLNREVPVVDSSIEIRTPLYVMFDRNGLVFGADQGAVSEKLQKVKMKDAIEKLCGREIKAEDFMKVLNDETLSDEQLKNALLRVNRRFIFTQNISEINALNNLIDQVIKNYPGMSVKEAIQFLYLLETEEAGGRGICNYASTVNLIFDKYKNNAKLFEKHFGFPMYIKVNGKQQLNTTMLLVDMYSIINDGVLVTNENGKYVIKYTNENYLNLTTSGKVAMEHFKKFLDKKGINFNINETFSYNSSSTYNMMHYEEVITNIHDSLAKGEHVHLTSDGFNLYYPNGKLASKDVGSHIMSVVGITSDGNLIVDSWGQKLIFNLREEMSGIGEYYEDSGVSYRKYITIVSYDISMDGHTNISNQSQPLNNSHIGRTSSLEVFDVTSPKSSLGSIPYKNTLDESNNSSRVTGDTSSSISLEDSELLVDVSEEHTLPKSVESNETVSQDVQATNQTTNLEIYRVITKSGHTDLSISKDLVERFGQDTIDSFIKLYEEDFRLSGYIEDMNMEFIKKTLDIISELDIDIDSNTTLGKIKRLFEPLDGRHIFNVSEYLYSSKSPLMLPKELYTKYSEQIDSLYQICSDRYKAGSFLKNPDLELLKTLKEGLFQDPRFDSNISLKVRRIVETVDLLLENEVIINVNDILNDENANIMSVNRTIYEQYKKEFDTLTKIIEYKSKLEEFIQNPDVDSLLRLKKLFEDLDFKNHYEIINKIRDIIYELLDGKIVVNANSYVYRNSNAIMISKEFYQLNKEIIDRYISIVESKFELINFIKSNDIDTAKKIKKLIDSNELIISSEDVNILNRAINEIASGKIVVNVNAVVYNNAKPITISREMYDSYSKANPNAEVTLGALYDLITFGSDIYKLLSNDTIIKNITNDKIKESLEYLVSIAERKGYEDSVIREARYLLNLLEGNYTTEELYDLFSVAHTEFNTPEGFTKFLDILKDNPENSRVDEAIRILENNGYTNKEISEIILHYASRSNNQEIAKKYYYKAFDYLVEKGMDEKKASMVISSQYETIIERRGTRVIATTSNGIQIKVINNLSTKNKLLTRENIESILKQAEKYYSKTGLREIIIYDTFDPGNIYSEKVQYEDYVRMHNNKRFTAAASANATSIKLWEDFDRLNSIIHEYGHTIDRHIKLIHNLSTEFSDTIEWTNAIKEDSLITPKRVSEYASATNAEDFAEFLQYFHQNPLEIALKYPNRYKAASKYLNLEIDSDIIQKYLDDQKGMIFAVEKLSKLLTSKGTMLEFIKQYLYDGIVEENVFNRAIISELNAIYDSKIEILEDYGVYSLFEEIRTYEKLNNHEFLSIIRDYLDGKDISSRLKDSKDLEIIKMIEKSEIQEWYEEELNESTAPQSVVQTDEESLTSSSDTSIMKDYTMDFSISHDVPTTQDLEFKDERVETKTPISEVLNKPSNGDSGVLNVVKIDGIEIEVDTLKQLQTPSNLETALKTGEYAGVRIEKALVELSKLDGVTLDSKLQEIVRISETLKQDEIIFNIEDVYSNGVTPNIINIDVYNAFLESNPNSAVSVDNLYKIINSNSVIYRLISNDTIIENVSNESIKESFEYLVSISNRYNYENKVIREAQYLLNLLEDNYTIEELYDEFAVAHTEFNTPDVYYEFVDIIKEMKTDSALKVLEERGYTSTQISEVLLNLAVRGKSQTYSKHFYYKAFDYLVEKGMDEKEASKIIYSQYETIIERRGTRVIATTSSGIQIKVINNLSTNNKLLTRENIESILKQAEKYYSKTGLREIIIYDTFNPKNIYSEKVQYEDYVRTHNNKRFTSAASANSTSIMLWEDFDRLNAIIHEYGHTVDRHIKLVNNLSTNFSDTIEWINAIKEDSLITVKRVSEYASASNGEDFAEFLKYFHQNPLEIALKYPNRYKAASKYLNLEIDSDIIQKYLDDQKGMIFAVEKLSKLLTSKGTMLEFIKQYLYDGIVEENVFNRAIISELNAIYDSKIEILEDYGVYSLFEEIRTYEKLNNHEFLSIIRDYLDGKDISSRLKDSKDLEIIKMIEKSEIQEWYEEELNESTAPQSVVQTDEESLSSSSDTSMVNHELSEQEDSLIEDADVEMALPKKRSFNSMKIAKVSVNDIPRVFRNMNTTDIISILEGKTRLNIDENYINNKKAVLSFIRYLSDNNLRLSLNEHANTVIENLRNTNFKLNVLNFNEVLNGGVPIFGPAFVEFNGTKISSEDIMIYLENKSNEISSIIISESPNEIAYNLLNAIYKLADKNGIILEKYERSIKLIERIANSYVYNNLGNYYLLPSDFNGIKTEYLFNSNEIGTTRYINSLSNVDKKNYKIALDELGRYIYRRNIPISENEYKRLDRLYDLLDVKRFRTTSIIKSRVYDTFEMSYMNGGQFGANQGKVRYVIEKLGINNVIEILFGNKIERANFLQLLSEIEISENDFMKMLSKINHRGIINNLFTEGDINLNLYKSLILQVKTNYPGMTTMEAVRFLYLVETVEAGIDNHPYGICNNPILVNIIFDRYLGNELQFEKDFGYPMYVTSNEGKKVLNDSRLLVDIYSTINDGVLVQKVNGRYVIQKTNRDYSRTYDLNGLKLDVIQRFIDKKGIKINISKSYSFNSNNEMMNYDYLMQKIKDELNNGNYLILGARGFDLYDENFEIIEDCDAHAMTIVGIDTNGNLIVDSWGKRCTIDLRKELCRTKELFKNRNGSLIERIFTILSYNLN